MGQGRGIGFAQGSEAMARLLVDGAELVVRLTWWEKIAARHGSVRVPLTAVEKATVQPDWWRGLPGHGVWVPGWLCVGVRHHTGQDFVAIRPGRQPVACVELGASAPFARVAVTTGDPGRCVAAIRAATGPAEVDAR
ncbi:hypothetical protein ACFOSC_10295 [Streptantibioticus rubrisoli]|uniref:Uncharacterized protein n=1 Tax=Streptantibioticus rubrisoli TaxID=1387313 RepID=A0ABT1PEF2_9ACTN|nr:hypothetical protein [Streptantibioticus rubrisoli]MCQ4042705.1 hypothetical protein [Streptantibioticus rubrisoli]